jgi:hypothetical protein
MAVVVEQTIPFSTSSLDLQNTNRWNGLLPLVRRSIKHVQTSKGHQLLINQSIIDSKFCNTVAVTTPGNFSSKLLDGSKVAAIVTEEPGKEGLTARDIKDALQEFGATEHQALVVVRSGKSRNLKASAEDNSIDVEVNGELEYDHLLFLLANRSKGSRRMIEDADGLVKDFFKNTITAYSAFHTDKVEGKPAISGPDGDSAAFKSVKDTVEKQLKGLFETQKDQSGNVTYSIHYSDVNGLSRLENYIIAKEIAEYCRTYREPTFEVLPLTNKTRLQRNPLQTIPLHNPQPLTTWPRLRHLSLPSSLIRTSASETASSGHDSRRLQRLFTLKDPLALKRTNQVQRRRNPQAHPRWLRRSHQRRAHNHRVRHDRRRRRLRLHAPRRRETGPSVHRGQRSYTIAGDSR